MGRRWAGHGRSMGRAWAEQSASVTFHPPSGQEVRGGRAGQGWHPSGIFSGTGLHVQGLGDAPGQTRVSPCGADGPQGNWHRQPSAGG